MRIVIGTPGRLKKLCDLGALHMSRVQLCMIDMARDVKERAWCDQKEVRQEFFELFHTWIAPTEAKLCFV